MRLIGYLDEGVRHIGVLDEDKVTGLGTVTDFYRAPQRVLADPTGPVHELAYLTLAPFVPETARIFCVGTNYRTHLYEAEKFIGYAAAPLPLIFGRWASTLVLDGDQVPVPPNEEGLDWEVELAAIIGTSAWQTTEDNALSHVLGYTGFNDLSARRKQLDTSQLTLGKNADRSGPIGPHLVTADAIDAKNLRVRTRLNGEVMQDDNTSQMINSVEAIIAYLTDTVTLLPGDVIATGTPGGVGVGRTPPRFAGPGDELEIEVQGIGTVRTPIVTRAQLAQ